MKQNSFFRPGKVWMDLDGVPIQAHGVQCYSSEELMNWKNEGLILYPELNDRANPLHPTRILDRPFIIYNEQTEQFVMWMKFVGSSEDPWNWNIQYLGVATSMSITGPFNMVKTLFPFGMNAGDFNLFIEPRDKKGYIIFQKPHTEIIIVVSYR